MPTSAETTALLNHDSDGPPPGVIPGLMGVTGSTKPPSRDRLVKGLREQEAIFRRVVLNRSTRMWSGEQDGCFHCGSVIHESASCPNRD